MNILEFANKVSVMLKYDDRFSWCLKIMVIFSNIWWSLENIHLEFHIIFGQVCSVCVTHIENNGAVFQLHEVLVPWAEFVKA